MRELTSRLRALITHAESSGAPPAWLEETAGLLVDALLELAALRQGDPRRQRTLRLAERVAHCHRSGTTIDQLCQRFGRSRSQIYRLLDVARLHATDSRDD